MENLQGWHPRLVAIVVSPRLEALESGNFSTTSPTSLHVFWRRFFLLGASSGDGKTCWFHVASDEASSDDIYHDIYAMDQCNLYLLVLHKKNSIGVQTPGLQVVRSTWRSQLRGRSLRRGGMLSGGLAPPWHPHEAPVAVFPVALLWNSLAWTPQGQSKAA